MSKIAPSILAADVLHLGDAAVLVKQTGCDYLHFDIMDGVFVPNISFGPHVLEGLKSEVDMLYDTHLMLADPLQYVDVFARSGSSAITVHIEACHFEQSIARIRQLGLLAGASLRPASSVEALQPYFEMLDKILVMTVEPGFGGQKMMKDQLKKIAILREMGYQGEIEVDGGITLENAMEVAIAGADTLVMGTAFFKAEQPQAVVNAIHKLPSHFYE